MHQHFEVIIYSIFEGVCVQINKFEVMFLIISKTGNISIVFEDQSFVGFSASFNDQNFKSEQQPKLYLHSPFESLGKLPFQSFNYNQCTEIKLLSMERCSRGYSKIVEPKILDTSENGDRTFSSSISYIS